MESHEVCSGRTRTPIDDFLLLNRTCIVQTYIMITPIFQLLHTHMNTAWNTAWNTT